MNAFYKNKHVLVTGGAGFIGSHITEKLVSLGAKVTVLDNLSSGNEDNLKNIKSKIKLIKEDVLSQEACEKATKHNDIIFHLAALVSVPYSIENPSKCWEINVMGTFNVLSAAVKNNAKTLIFSSSSAVYGDKQQPCSENDDTNPKSPYAESKIQAENICNEFSSKYGIKTASLRYFNVFGERQKFNSEYAAVVAKFEKAIKNNEPLVIYGDGKQTRDFIHVSEVVNANLFIAMQNQISGDIFNIGSGNSMNLFELIEYLENKLNKKNSGIFFKPARNGDIVYSAAICEKYENLKQTLNQKQL
ncbi:TPA: nucleoside-diphosphate sugar epimerase [Candidatus Dependentiae bacterium]|nr:MAG: UDP-glucose 4-epimerase [candidate division TM6 bacterium GW2011_GWE2_31_21]KKP52989.1 MAG: UDP-glucose 4-epimerase [candidate division TM6 bacterium GW2011_GWF2_33_332]HBS47773.1 nucleoside-diphosphate sugar epimerase [Candidatus Dependentiae bacterium]HBZ73251.1 nucleoside-diphosphate sugar epimerase [Candidatus Dependentiae bacterium]